jgi:mRNA-degrading endonuclease toxin of MazEF toxin-antitoxin module
VIALSTTTPKDWPIYVPVPSISPDTQAVIDQIRAMDKSRFPQRIGRASSSDIKQIDEALREVLSLLNGLKAPVKRLSSH